MKASLFGIHLVAFTLAAFTSTRAATITAANPLVQIEGRTVSTPLQGVRIGYPGVALHLCVRGTSLSVRAANAAEDADFDVLVDGGQARRIKLPRGTADTVLFADLADAEHQVELVHCTESYNGSCELESFSSPGEFLAPPGPPPHRLLFLGDSFTCGAAAGVRPGEPINSSKAGRQNARLSYGWLLARQLSAQVSIVAYAGRGLMRDWQGIRSVSCFPEFYEYALPDDPTSLWSPTNYVPDAIGICVGNDFDIGLPDEVDFVRAYTEFVRKLRRDAPNAMIVLILSPILTDPPSGMPQRSVLQAYLDEVVKLLGDPRVVVADIGTYPVVPGDGHPDGAAHAAVADKLAPLFRRALE
jgi:hypothetical protein